MLPQLSTLADRIIDVTPNQKAIVISITRLSWISTMEWLCRCKS